MGTLLGRIGLWVKQLHANIKATPAESTGWSSNRLIAHALGGINTDTYTNSYEAFLLNYQKGHRLFEADLMLTSDGHLVARHDWFAYLQPSLPPDKRNMPLTLKEFKQYAIYDRYTPLDFHDIARLMQQDPEICLVTDTKETDPELIAKQFNIIKSVAEQVDPCILDRIIPEIYNPEMFRIVKSIYPFKHCFYSIYLTDSSDTEVVKFVLQNEIPAVAMPAERATRSFLRLLNVNGIPAYVFTLNTAREMNKYRKIGVYGFYTDFVTYSDLNWK